MSDILEDMIYRRTLSCGTIQVTRDQGEVSLDDLFDIAERRNPKRAFLFVSKVLGRHIPVPPSVMRQAYRQLASQFPSTLTGPVLFIGMAETAVGLGAGVFDEVRHQHRESVYLTSTRHPVDGTLLCEFKEEHSHATDHLIYLPDDEEKRRRVTNARTLVLIDDEATTGNTFINLLSALRNTGKLQHIEQVIAVTLTDWSGNALSERTPLPVTSVSLVSGQWGWTPLPDAPVPDMPKVNVTSRGEWDIQGNSHGADWGCSHLRPISAMRSPSTRGNVFWFSGPGNSSGSRSCLLNGSKLPEHRHFMDRPPAPLSPLVMPLSPPFPLRITTGWASPILSITSPTSSLTAFLCVLRHPQKVLTRSFLKRWLRLRPSWRLLPMNKPVVLSDLDDTLFQTRRKMVDELALEPFRTGAVDRTLNPRSFMTEEQSMLVDWLLEQAELIPVTARGTEEISRVRIPFHSWAITTHGAVILTPEGKPDEEWKAHMLGQLAPTRKS